MTDMDAAAWDRRYATSDYVWRTEPNRFVPPEIEGLAPGRAVDLACGEGRNAVWLATRGWDVTGVDISRVGLDKGAELARRSGVSVDWVLADATGWTPVAPVDLALICYLQLPAGARRAATVAAARSLAPGGTFLLVGHDLANLTGGVGGPQHPDVLFTAEDVVADLAAAQVEDLVVVRAGPVERPVETDEGPRTAIDCLVRAHRSAPDAVGS